MEDTELKRIGNNISQGHFDDCIAILGKKIIKKHAIYLIVCCCTTCNANIDTTENIKEEDVVNLLKGLSKAIVEVSSEEYDTYIQSIFFICKLLLRKNYEIVLQLEAEIIPSFIPEKLTENQKGIYRSLCVLIRNEIMNVVSKKKDIDESKVVSMGYFLSKILIGSMNVNILSEFILSYGTTLRTLNVGLKLQYHYFMFNCELVKGVNVEVLSATVFDIIRYGLHIYSCHLRNGIVSYAKKIITELLFITTLSKECKCFKEVLDICEHLINGNIEVVKLNNCKDSFMIALDLYKYNKNFLALCKTISSAAISFSYFCKDHDTEKIFCNPDLHSCFYEIFNAIIEYFISLSQGDKKTFVINIREISDLAISIILLFSTLVSNDYVNGEFTTKVLSYMEKYCEHLVSMRGHCEKLDSTWSDLSAYLYNLGVINFRKEDNEGTLLISHLILKYHFLFEELENELVLPNTMGLLSSVYMKKKLFNEALTWTSMQIMYTKDTSNNGLFNKLLKIKAAARENDVQIEIQELTVCSAIQRIPSEYKSYLKPIHNLNFQINLLINELTVYHQKWRSKVPMMSAFRQLCDIADNFTLMKVFVEVFSDWETHVHETVVKLLEQIFISYENSIKKGRSKKKAIFLPFVYFFRYKVQNVEIISKNVQEMDKTSRVLRPPEYTVDIMPADAYVQCDVVSTYEGLTIKGEKMKHLEKSLKELEIIISGDITMSLFEDINIEKVYTLATNLALEFQLHSDLYHSFKAFNLAFTIAVCSESKMLIVECGGHMLKYFKNNELEKKVEEEISYSIVNEHNLKYIVQYYLNLSHIYLSENNVSVAIKHFESALEYLNSWIGMNKKYLWSIEITVELLRFKLMQASKISNLATRFEWSFGPLMKAHDLMVQKYSTEVEWGPQCMILLFDVLESIVKIYHDLKMPREVRCFGKQALTVAQQHQIPMHSVRFLSYLAHADFRSERLDDCRVKMEGISEILLLENEKRFPRPYICATKSSMDQPVADVTEGIQEMMLDHVNTASFNVILSPSSPVYIGDPYKHPQFSDHENCECFKCTCIEYQQLTVSRFHLEALWYMYKKQITLAKSFFKGTSEFYQILTIKKMILPKNLPLCSYFSINRDANMELKTSLNEYYYQCSIDYIKFLYTSGAQESAKTQTKSLTNQVKLEKNIYPNLYGEALLQRLGIIYQNKLTNKVSHLGQSTSCKDDSKFRTPQKYTSKIIIPKEPSPKIKRFLPPKVIKFSLAEFETDDKNKKSPSININKQKKTPLKTPRIKTLPPSLRNTKTPILKTPYGKTSAAEGNNVFQQTTSSFSVNTKIYENTPLESKTFSKKGCIKRLPLFEIPEPSAGCDNDSIPPKITNKSDIVIKDHLMGVKTKLLTAKLQKQNNENPVSSASCGELGIASVRRSTRRKRL